LSIVLFKNSDENNLPAFYLKVNKENMLRLSSLYGNLPGYHRCLEALYFILKTWSFGPGQSPLALPEESLQEFEVN
jgi:hypothetical protein